MNIFDSVSSTATTVDVNSWKIPHEGLLCVLFCEFHLNSYCLILVHHETAAHSNPTGKHINTKKHKNKEILRLTYTSMEWIGAHPWICASSVLLGPELHILPDQVRLIRWITSGKWSSFSNRFQQLLTRPLLLPWSTSWFQEVHVQMAQCTLGMHIFRILFFIPPSQI